MDGFKCDPDKDETYGVFTNDFSDARHPEMLEDMIKVGPPQNALQNHPKPVSMIKKLEQKIEDMPLMKHKSEQPPTLNKMESEGTEYKIGGGVPPVQPM